MVLTERTSHNYEIAWNSSVEPARKGYAGTMFLYKKDLKPSVSFPTIGAPSTMDVEGRIITLEFDNFYLTQVYTPNPGDGLNRLEERQGFANLLEKGFTDSFRYLHGDVTDRYTW